MFPSDLGRRAYVVLSIACLGPMVATGLWRPLIAWTGADPAGMALRVCVGAAALAALGALGGRAGRLAWVLGLVGGYLGAGGLPAAVTLALVGFLADRTAPRLLAGLPESLDALPREHPVGAACWAIVVLLCLILDTRVAIFLADAAFADFNAPGPELTHFHYCATAYLHAAELVRAGVDNIYDLALVPDEGGFWLPPTAAHMAPFKLDRYGYPPQFVLAPLAILRLAPDFPAQRALWSAACAVFVALSRWRMGLWVGPRGGLLLLLGAPLIWGLGVLNVQIGNVQAAVECVAALAMMAVHEGRDRRGGLLLATATLGKIAPGLLGVVLLVQRRWKAAAWTFGWAVLLSLVSLGVMGWGPFDAFLHVQLPNVASGAAYDFLDDAPEQVFQNLSPFAIPFKLVAMGATLDPWVWGPKVTSVFTAAVFVLAAVAGLQRPGRRGALAVAMVVFTFACMRSPMAPPYVLTAVQVALLLALAEWEGPRRWVGFVVTVNFVVFLLPNDIIPMAFSLIAQLLVWATMAWLALRRWPALEEAG